MAYMPAPSGSAPRPQLFTRVEMRGSSQGPVSFANLKDRESVSAFLEEYYPSALPVMPTAAEDFLSRPVGYLATLFMGPWTFEGKFALIGDSAHAFTPFFGQVTK